MAPSLAFLSLRNRPLLRAALLFIPVLILLVAQAEAQTRRRRPAPRRAPARPARLDPKEIEIRILQREDSRWIGSDTFLFDQTRSPIAAVKLRALLALGRIGDPRALPTLFERFKDPSLAVRRRALFAAGEILDASNLEHEGIEARPDWITPVAAMLTDKDPGVRARAMEAMGKTKDRSYAEPLTAALLHEKGGVEPIRHGLLALARMGAGSGLASLAGLRSHASFEVRWQLANAVFRSGDAAAAAELRPLLGDGQAIVRANAARAYGLTGAGAVEPLAALLSDSIPAVQIGAARGLALTRAPDAVRPLAAAIERMALLPESSDLPLIAVLEAWGELRPATGRDAVTAIARQRRPASAAAWVALAKARKGDETFARETSVEGAPLWLKRAQVQALGENASAAAVEKLLMYSSTLRGVDTSLIPWCLDALVESARPLHPETFWRFLQESDPMLRAHAMQALTALARRSATPPEWGAEAAERVMRSYVDFQAEAVTDARLAAAEFLSTLNASVAVSRLERIAADPDRNVRLRARGLLRSRFARTLAAPSGLVNTGRNYAFYAGALTATARYWGARFVTDRGTWTVRFLGKEAPLTVYSFIALTQTGYFDGLTFPRVVPDFVIQGGDPRNDTDGSPGYALRCEINDQPFVRGSVGMALSGKDTGGSQYFISHSPQPHLDGGYTLFAQVTDGLAVVDRIRLGDRVQRVELIPVSSAPREAPSTAEPGRGATGAEVPL